MPARPATLHLPEPLAADTYLSRKHRALVALYSLAANPHARARVLAQNHVSEADLAEFEEEWRLLRRRSRGVV